MNGAGVEPSGSLSQRTLIGLAATLTFVFVGVIVMFNVTHSTSRVVGPSMLPTLAIGDVTLVTRGYDRPLRGDIVIIRADDESVEHEDSGLIKRIIAAPGDRVEVRSGRALVNGRPEQGTYSLILAEGDLSFPPTTLGPDEVFVLGDNRPDSADSRVFGPVPVHYIQGKIRAVIAPIYRIRPIR